MKNIVLIGHRGALGQSIEKVFLQGTSSVLIEDNNSSRNIHEQQPSTGWIGWGLDPRNQSSSSTTFPNVFKKIRSIEEIPKYQKIDAVVCVAGAYEGNASEESPQAQLSRMWTANVEPSLIAANFALQKKVSTLILTGSHSAYEGGTPYAISYGLCKAAVHHLTRSLGEDKAFSQSRIVCLLPQILDTPANRKNMPNEDFKKWTSTDAVAKLVLEICNGKYPSDYEPKMLFLKV